jgi:flagellar motor switch protein FliN/FliY
MGDQPQENVEEQFKNQPLGEELVEEDSDKNMPDINQLEFEKFDKSVKSNDSKKRMDLIMDLVLPVSIELGRTKMFVKDILELDRGSVVELDKLAGEPVDLYINEKKMAVGEVVVVDKHFGIRITNLIDPQDRIKNLGKDL